jgi:multisubunit Na+/H+ antiporter MnhE subunit
VNAARGLAESACWAAVACAVWLATLSSVTVPELSIAIVLSVPCGLLARAGRRALDASWRFRLRWLAWPFPVAATLVVELGKLVHLAAFSPHSGTLTDVALPDEPPELAAGRAVAATFALCSTPGSLVVDTEVARRRLVVHALVSGGPDLQEVVQR